MGIIDSIMGSLKKVGDYTEEEAILKSVRSSVESFISALRGIIGKMEGFLKRAKSGLKEGAEALKAKTKGFGETLREKGKGAGESLRERFNRYRDRATEPNTEGGEPIEGELLSAKPSFRERVMGGVRGAKRSLNDWADKAAVRRERRRQEVADEKAATQKLMEGKKKKEGGSWLISMMSGIQSALMSVGGFMVDKLLGGFSSLAGGLLRGLGKGLFKSGVFSGGIAKATQKALGGVFRLGGTAVLRALPIAGTLMAGVGSAALTGASALLLNPITLAIAGVAVAGYGAYKLTQWMTEDNLPDGDAEYLTRIRLLSYGFNDDYEDYYSNVFELEMIMKDLVKFDASKGTLAVARPNEEQVIAMFKAFDIDVEDEDDREKARLFNRWYSERFIPAFHAYWSAAKSADPTIYTDNISSFKPVQIDKFLSAYKIPAGVFNCKVIPAFSVGTQSPVIKADVEVMISKLRDQIKDRVASGESPEKKLLQEEKKRREKAAKDQKQQENNREANTESWWDSTANAAKNLYGRTKDAIRNFFSSDAETPSTFKGKDNKPGGGVNRLAQAGGTLVQGDGSLMGISLANNIKETAIHSLDPNVRDLFTGMAKEYNALTGKNIPVNSGFRSMEEQERLHRENPSKAAPPGKSLHEYGLAIDVNSATVAELDRMGLLRKYGFTAPVGGEGWHLEPIGVSLDTERAKTDQEFRKTAIVSSIGRGGSGYGANGNGTKYRRDINTQRMIYDSVVSVSDPATLQLASDMRLGNKPTTVSTGPVAPLERYTPQTVPTRTAAVPAANDSEPKQGPGTPWRPSGYQYSGQMGKDLRTAQLAENMDVVKAIEEAAKLTGMDKNTLLTFGKLESSLRGGVKASTSGATGLMQFTPSTWAAMLKKHGGKYGIPMNASPTNPLYSAILAAEYMKENMNYVTRAKELGIADPVALYLAHYLGPGGARSFISQTLRDPNTPMASVVSRDSYRANPNMHGKTAGQFLDSIQSRYAAASGEPATRVAVAGSSSYGGSVTGASSPWSDSSSGAAASPNVSVTPPPPAPRPSVMAASYSNSATSPAPASDYGQPAQPAMQLQLTSTDALLSSQLETLGEIVSVLKLIDGKLDFSKLPGGQKEATPSAIQPIPNVSVNLSRRQIA